LQQESKFEGWLFAIALNGLRREWERAGAGKRKGLHVAIAPEEEAGPDTIADLASAQPDPQTTLLERERIELLHAALLELPEQRRRCTLLYINGELKYQQIADLMGISLNTVKAHLHHAKDSLRKKLSPLFNEIEF
jgi:RNA polymerase sigma-70 factor (ECF subfamily)